MGVERLCECKVLHIWELRPLAADLLKAAAGESSRSLLT